MRVNKSKFAKDSSIRATLFKGNWHPEENLVVNNKDNRVFMSRNYRSDSCPLEI